MTNPNTQRFTEFKTGAWWAGVICSIVISLFLIGLTTSIVVSIVQSYPELSFKLLPIDWQAIGSIISLISLVVSVVAIYFAAWVVKATLLVDKQQAQRAEDARLIRAFSIAPPLAMEVGTASALAEALVNDAKKAALTDTAKALDIIHNGIEQLHMPITERLSDRFIDFDLETARTLAMAVGVYARLAMKPPSEYLPQSKDDVDGAYVVLIGSLAGYSAVTAKAQNKLMFYVRQPQG